MSITIIPKWNELLGLTGLGFWCGSVELTCQGTLVPHSWPNTVSYNNRFYFIQWVSRYDFM